MCYLSRIQWKKAGNGIKITSLYEPFEAIATFGAICSKFLAKHRNRDSNFSENILLKVDRHSFFKSSQDSSLLQFELLQ